MSKEKARETLRRHIESKGLRNTRQRETILEAFLSSDRHITAEELHALIKKKNPEIGFATVHRNLALFCESGLAAEIKIGSAKTRYEPAVGFRHHDHLICLRCGRFIEVTDEKIERLQDKLAADNGFRPTSHKMEIYGFCRACQ